MKKLYALIVCCLLMVPATAYGATPYDTLTENTNGEEVWTQTTFIPLGQFQQDSRLMNPEDLFIDQEGNVYAADAGTKSVLKYSSDGEFLAEFGLGTLQQPIGLFVTDTGDVYVADYGASKVFRFNQDNELVQEYGKPDSPLFGTSSNFKPRSLILDRRGNLYIISEGSTNGIIQLSQNGEFLGYYGVNRTQNSVTSVVREMLSLDEGLFMKNPPAPQNIAIDNSGLIYSVTQGAEIELIKKLNVAGDNLFPLDIVEEGQFTDLTVDKNGNLFVIDQEGVISEFDSFGNFLFKFSGTDDGSNRWGLSQSASSIAVDNNGFLYVSDRERGLIQRFGPTPFMNEVHAGTALFKEGLYLESREYWENVLDLNASFGIAHTALGHAYFKEERYDDALEQYTLAEDRLGYSDAFWELRHRWLQQNLGSVLLGVILLTAIYYVLKWYNRKTRRLTDLWSKRPRFKLMSDLLFIGAFIKRPIDSFYYIRKQHRGTVLSASILYLALIAIYLIFRLQTGFIFSTVDRESFSLLRELVTVIAPVLLFLIANYLVSTINDGQGKFRDIYIATIYALAPYLLFMIPVTLMSNVLTLNESFLFDYAVIVIYGWCLIILYFMIKEIHNYSISETVRNILLTIFGMILLVLIGFILYILLNQVIDFLFSVISEVMVRV